jgi:hypothetical protein
MLKRTLPGFVAGVVVTTLVAGGGAVAATGGKFILGKSNASTSTTTLTAKRGPALSLKANGAPALRVDNARKVPNLNADRIDGLDSTQLARTSAKSGAYDFTGQLVDLDENGLDDAIIAAATCPAGSQMTGGGAMDLTATGVTFVNTPNTGESWLVAVLISEDATESGEDVVASVVCYNAKGTLPGSYRRPTDTSAAPARELVTLAREKAAALRR